MIREASAISSGASAGPLLGLGPHLVDVKGAADGLGVTLLPALRWTRASSKAPGSLPARFLSGRRRPRWRSWRVDAMNFVAPGPGADPGPKTPFGPLLRLLLERSPGQTQESCRDGRALPGRSTRGGSDPTGGGPCCAQARLGGDDPSGVRSRPPLYVLAAEAKCAWLHHPARRDHANSRSSPKAREGLSPASPCPAACGQPRLRSAPS
jgi:hypothetical protein